MLAWLCVLTLTVPSALLNVLDTSLSLNTKHPSATEPHSPTGGKAFSRREDAAGHPRIPFAHDEPVLSVALQPAWCEAGHIEVGVHHSRHAVGRTTHHLLSNYAPSRHPS